MSEDTATVLGIAGRIVPGIGILVKESPPAPVSVLNCQVLVWGDIGNRKELAGRLGIQYSATTSKSEADAILIAHAWRQWGEQFPCHVLGEYAAVLYDPFADRAFLSHDSMGMAPLYYSEADSSQGKDISFATHLADLLTLLGDRSAARLDQEYLADFLARGYVATARTPFLDIRRLMQGCGLVWTAGRGVREARHWNLADIQPLALHDNREYEERFRELLTEGVRGAIDGAGVVWTHLSGGLDSSSIACIAAELQAPGLAAWSVYCPSFTQADERKWMREVVDKYRLPWHLTDAEELLPFSSPPGRFLGEPTISVIHEGLSSANNRLYASHDVEVTLSGHGGDAVLGAFPGPEVVDLADPLFRGDLLSSLRGVRHWRRESTERRSYLYWLTHCLAKPALQHLRGRAITTASRLPLQPWFQPEYVQRMHLNRRQQQRYAPRCLTPGRQQLADSLLIAALQTSLDAQRERSFRVRNPLMSRRLVEFMCAVPFEQKMRPRCDRYLQRCALKGILPEPIRRRAGKGTGTTTFVEGLSRSPEWIDYLTHDSRLAAYGIADAGLWELAVQQASVGQTNGDQFFHAGLAVEVWLHQLEEHRRSGTALSSPAKKEQPLSAVSL